MNQYPEHDKLAKVAEQTQAAGDFVEWLNEQGYVIGHLDPHGRLWPASKVLQSLLADWKGIDRDALEREKRAMLDAIRTRHTGGEA